MTDTAQPVSTPKDFSRIVRLLNESRLLTEPMQREALGSHLAGVAPWPWMSLPLARSQMLQTISTP